MVKFQTKLDSIEEEKKKITQIESGSQVARYICIKNAYIYINFVF